jgi:hypothetical protein
MDLEIRNLFKRAFQSHFLQTISHAVYAGIDGKLRRDGDIITLDQAANAHVERHVEAHQSLEHALQELTEVGLEALEDFIAKESIDIISSDLFKGAAPAAEPDPQPMKPAPALAAPIPSDASDIVAPPDPTAGNEAAKAALEAALSKLKPGDPAEQ